MSIAYTPPHLLLTFRIGVSTSVSQLSHVFYASGAVVLLACRLLSGLCVGYIEFASILTKANARIYGLLLAS
jgi:hypothetical protein